MARRGNLGGGIKKKQRLQRLEQAYKHIPSVIKHGRGYSYQGSYNRWFLIRKDSLLPGKLIPYSSNTVSSIKAGALSFFTDLSLVPVTVLGT